ncbi:LysR family transcriptional regulator [Aquabacterium sp.]|uniref:LysR family transcriptional regulator n=1 Tax=Aquabacterium sp. TaxID=1872578 RepID=UPI002B61E243|nr:LysR family transcriptional regulator [Aquabacterium sp.]HSW05330.1 LysR family transcriptional regulator [Aquabacterium sp.]
MTELRQLRQFIAVAEELHFGRAATRLHMTQPPLTMAIQALERELGAALFARTRRSVQLTPAGFALLPQAQRLLAAADALPQLAQAAAAGLSGQLRLAFVSNIAYGPLPEWLRSFRLAHPEVALQLREATLDVQLAAFDADEIDAGFVLHAPDAAPAGFAVWTAQQEPLVMALPEQHPAATQRALRFAAVAAEPLVIFPRQIAPSLYDAVLSAYRAQGITPRIAQEAIQMQTIVNLVSAGMGVAWVPESVTQLQRPGVTYRAVIGAALRCETSLLWREPALPVVERFVAHVQGVKPMRPAKALRRQSAAAGLKPPRK